MTNYNERLDEQLNYLMEYSYKYGRCEIPSSEDPPLIVARQAKQAITSLIKELVAEAKPERKSTEDYGSWEDGHRNAGWNKCLDQFEQNLLKELEEV